MRRALILLAGAAWLAAAPAHAVERLYGSDPGPCDAGAGVVSVDTAIDYLMNAAGTPWSGELARARLDGRLGETVGSSQQLLPLYQKARALVTGGSGGLPFEVAVDPGAPADTRQRATDFLDGKAPWLSLTCPAAAAGSGASGAAPLQDFMIRASLEDVAKDVETADPASFSWTRDRDARSEQTDVSLLVATPVIGAGRWAVPVRLYGAYQRSNGSEPVNDLTFGALVNQPVHLLGAWEILTTSAGWETDDRFKSSAFRADANLAIPFSICGRGNTGKAGLMCTPVLSADYVHVADAGDKTSLQDTEDFARIGGSFDATAWVHLGTTATLWVKGGYAFREDLGGGKGDAHLTTASVMLSPPDDERFSVGVEWKQGRDLSSLEHVDQVSLKLAWKQ